MRKFWKWLTRNRKGGFRQRIYYLDDVYDENGQYVGYRVGYNEKNKK